MINFLGGGKHNPSSI